MGPNETTSSEVWLDAATLVTGIWAAFVWSAGGRGGVGRGVGLCCAQIDDTVIIITAACNEYSAVVAWVGVGCLRFMGLASSN